MEKFLPETILGCIGLAVGGFTVIMSFIVLFVHLALKGAWFFWIPAAIFFVPLALIWAVADGAFSTKPPGR